MATTTHTASWGVSSGAPSTVAGVVTEYTVREEAVTAEEANELGAVIGVVHYDTRKTAEFTVQVAAGTAVPSAGTAVTVSGQAYYVKTAEAVESNRDFRRIRVTAEAYANCAAATAAAQGSSGPGGAA